MIVGEAPGWDEMKAKQPFVGRSGKLLESVLRSFGISREEVYITNVVKEIPTDEQGAIRRPWPEEIATWAPVLNGEIEHTAPAAILALGRTASDTLTGVHVAFGSKIENVYTAWHPAFLLRSGWQSNDYDRPDASSSPVAWREQIRPWVEAWR